MKAKKQSKNKLIEFKEELEALIKKYKIIPDPIIGFDLIAFMSNYSEREIRRKVTSDPTFPDIYELSYHNKGCKLSEVEKWIELHNKKPLTINVLECLQVHQ
ncbi:hypothetical protein [Commensalibacter papalotli (ex Botero et al. 2024)]|uniref:hypothetical protein n=1 Tax=Commensalibacter papalotli (ex Botero et al. 2024) TaxID=2972766 RepID=UPI0022FF6DCA|nr:hypothetical protein [Commensalibacter papalotli (ex Botero et al. 2024)]CAI3948747.1 unnamed protein product [Commensalibacter papalotli (ex Botero et al. 2024)]